MNAPITNAAADEVRFSVLFCGDIKEIALADGTSKDLHNWEKHDEGWSETNLVLTRQGSMIVMEEFSDGTDCDGRMQRSATYTCDAADLANVSAQITLPNGTCVQAYLPSWNLLSSSQRDFQAEAAGY